MVTAVWVLTATCHTKQGKASLSLRGPIAFIFAPVSSGWRAIVLSCLSLGLPGGREIGRACTSTTSACLFGPLRAIKRGAPLLLSRGLLYCSPSNMCSAAGPMHQCMLQYLCGNAQSEVTWCHQHLGSRFPPNAPLCDGTKPMQHARSKHSLWPQAPAALPS